MGSSSPAWLAKDPAAQKHLGKYKKDARGLIWFVDRIDTSDKGDVARLRRIGQANRRRNVRVDRLEKLYTDEKVAEVDLSAPIPTETGQQAHFDKERESLVVKLAQPLYPRLEVPVTDGWYWRQHRLWEVVPSGERFVFLHGGIVRSVTDVPGPWFGPVPPPEDWK